MLVLEVAQCQERQRTKMTKDRNGKEQNDKSGNVYLSCGQFWKDKDGKEEKYVKRMKRPSNEISLRFL